MLITIQDVFFFSSFSLSWVYGGKFQRLHDSRSYMEMEYMHVCCALHISQFWLIILINITHIFSSFGESSVVFKSIKRFEDQTVWNLKPEALVKICNLESTGGSQKVCVSSLERNCKRGAPGEICGSCYLHGNCGQAFGDACSPRQDHTEQNHPAEPTTCRDNKTVVLLNKQNITGCLQKSSPKYKATSDTHGKDHWQHVYPIVR